MLSDISQTEKEKYCMVFLTCGIFRKKERVKLIETDSRKVVAKGWELVGGMARLEFEMRRNSSGGLNGWNILGKARTGKSWQEPNQAESYWLCYLLRSLS